MKMTSNSTQNRQKIQNTEIRKTGFLKEKVGNEDLCKSVMNKIITTHEQCIKNSFVAPLMIMISIFGEHSLFWKSPVEISFI